jgi:hypothetical protein
VGADDRISVRLPDGMRETMRQARGEVSESEFVTAAITAALDDAGPDQLVDIGLMPGLPVTSEIQPGGIASPGVACSWPECWARDTRRYGATDPGELTRGGYRECPRDAEKCGLALCPAHAARLDGFRFVRPREVPRSAARAREPA